MSGPPLEVRVLRGEETESRHLVALAVVDVAGRVVLAAGDTDRPVFARSAIKPIQALPLIETGAADAFDLGDTEIALASASHGGEPGHVAAVTAWLERIGCTAADLVCAAGNAAADNCSGKHAGFLTTAKHLEVRTRGYHRIDHPVQQYVLGMLEQMTGLDLGAAPRATDGCGIPAIALPLGNVALAMARLADPADQPDTRQAACARVRRAMAAEPWMVAGTGRFCTAIIEALGEAALVKTGAEGVYCAALTGLGLGVALKAEDGARRAAQHVMGRVLQRLDVIDDATAEKLRDALSPEIVTRAGQPAGRLEPGPDDPF